MSGVGAAGEGRPLGQLAGPHRAGGGEVAHQEGGRRRARCGAGVLRTVVVQSGVVVQGGGDGVRGPQRGAHAQHPAGGQQERTGAGIDHVVAEVVARSSRRTASTHSRTRALKRGSR